jgi:hypothetical protein
VANWQTHFFSEHNSTCGSGLRMKLSLPTVANSPGKLAKLNFLKQPQSQQRQDGQDSRAAAQGDASNNIDSAPFSSALRTVPQVRCCRQHGA